MKSALVLCLIAAGLVLASAKSYSLQLLNSAMLGNTELKAGDYQVEVIDQKAVITKGKLRIENPVSDKERRSEVSGHHSGAFRK